MTDTQQTEAQRVASEHYARTLPPAELAKAAHAAESANLAGYASAERSVEQRLRDLEERVQALEIDQVTGRDGIRHTAMHMAIEFLRCRSGVGLSDLAPAAKEIEQFLQKGEQLARSA